MILFGASYLVTGSYHILEGTQFEMGVGFRTNHRKTESEKDRGLGIWFFKTVRNRLRMRMGRERR